MKNNKTYIAVSFIILVFGIIFIPKIVNRMKNGNVIQNDRLNISRETTGRQSDLVVMADAPKFSLTNQDGKTITQEFYKDKVYVVEFFFATCPTICPVMNQNMLEIEREFINNKNFGIVSITIDPKHDTPEVLKNYANNLGVKSENWNFLTGDRDYIYDLANKNFKIFAGENEKVAGGFEHSGLFALIDKNGKVRCRKDKNGNPIFYYSGENFSDPEGMETDLEGKYKPGVVAIKEDIKKLLQE
jgi:protein SCO1